MYLGLSCERRLRQGDFAGTRAQIAKLADIADVYGSDFAQSNQYPEQARLLLEERKLEPALAAVHEYYTSRLEKLFNLVAHGWNAKLWSLLGDRSRAAAALAEAEKTMAGLAQVPLFHRSTYLLSRFLYDVTALEEALVAGGRGDLGTLKHRARRSGRAAVKSAARLASERTETYRLAGRLRWLLGKQDQALRWWTRSIAAGERLGARPELARTRMEVGLRLAESGARQRALNGIDATAYLEQARSQFAELGLEWDLEQLAKSGHAAAQGVVTAASEDDARLLAERR